MVKEIVIKTRRPLIVGFHHCVDSARQLFGVLDQI